jgi:hypothetical protein
MLSLMTLALEAHHVIGLRLMKLISSFQRGRNHVWRIGGRNCSRDIGLE